MIENGTYSLSAEPPRVGHSCQHLSQPGARQCIHPASSASGSQIVCSVIGWGHWSQVVGGCHAGWLTGTSSLVSAVDRHLQGAAIAAANARADSDAECR